VVPRLGGPTNLKPPERGTANLLKLLSRFTGFLTTKGADKKNQSLWKISGNHQIEICTIFIKKKKKCQA